MGRQGKGVATEQNAHICLFWETKLEPGLYSPAAHHCAKKPGSMAFWGGRTDPSRDLIWSYRHLHAQALWHEHGAIRDGQ